MIRRSMLRRSLWFMAWFSSSIIATLLLCELSLRLFDPIGISYVFDAKSYFAGMAKDPRYSYIHRANQTINVGGISARINKEGFRGADFSVQKPEHRLRVLLLGDSVVFSWGVAESSMLNVELRDRLAREGLADIEVLPIGVGSWNTRTQWEFMSARGFEYQPDVIVHIVVNNDIQPKSGGKTYVPAKELFSYKSKANGLLQSWWRSLTDYSYTAAAIQRLFAVRNLESELVSFYQPDTPQERDVKNAFSHLVQECRNRKVPLIGFLYGEVETPIGQLYSTFFHDIYRRENVELRTFPSALYESHYQNSLIDDHRNAAGIRLMANAISDVLSPLLIARKAAAPPMYR